MCDTMNSDQMELYVSLKIQSLRVAAESSERLHSVGMVHAADVGTSVVKVSAQIVAQTFQHVDHLISAVSIPWNFHL